MKLPEITWVATKAVALLVLASMALLLVLRVVGINLIASWGAWWLTVIVAGSVTAAGFIRENSAAIREVIEKREKGSGPR